MKRLLSIIIVLLSVVISVDGVYADTVSKKSSTSVYLSNKTPIDLYYPSASGGKPFITYTFTVKHNGLSFVGYCLDYNRHMTSGTNVTCHNENSYGGKALAYYSEHLTGNDSIDAITMHMIGILTSLNKTNYLEYEENTALVKWLQNKTGLLSFPTEDLPYGNTGILEQAYGLAVDAINNAKKDSIKNSLVFTKVSTEGNVVTYNVTSRQVLTKEQVDFTCEGCEIKSKEWNGTSGKLVVMDTKEDCNYVINAYYPASGTMICSCGEDCQNIAIFSATSEQGEKIDTSGTPTQYFGDYINEGDYFKNVCGGKTNKCSDEVPGVQVNVNNCCEDSTTSNVTEPSLNDLFCRDTDLNVDYYAPKPGAQQYIEYDHDMDTNYCKMYCTERIQVDIPGAMTATNGKYFQLQKNSVSNTYAPHVESVKRCRIRIEYDKWIKDYQEQVNVSMEAYNSHQKNSAYYELYKDAKKESQTALNVNVYCSAISGEASGIGSDGSYVTIKSNSASGTYALSNISSFTYDKYTFNPNGERYYYRSVKIENTLREKYTSEKIIDGGQNYEATTSPNPKYWSDSLLSTISSINSALNKDGNTVPGSCNYSNGLTACAHYSCSASAGANQLLSLVESIEDVETKRDSYKSARDNAEGKYNAAVAQIKNLQETLTHCDNYFNEVEPTDIYNVPTSMSNFKYTQVYQDEYGNPKQTQVTVGFSGSCTITRKDGAPDTFATTGGTINYSSDPYGRIYEIMKVFGGKLSYDKEQSGNANFYKQFIAEDYEANKMFWHDGAYQATCDWNRTDVDKYTLDNGDVVSWDPSKGNNYRLVPRGEVYNYEQSLKNYTEHEYVFTYSTSYDGHFETYWNLQGLGEDGKFDSYFENAGTTCSSQSPAESELLTCRLHGFHGGSFYGCCCGDDGYTSNSSKSCESYGDKAMLYDFKVIDPVNVFPAETKGYAENWKTNTGKEAKSKIEELGKELNTYSPSTLSYSFKLTPSDMKQIKDYNKILNNYGGYTDFNLSCDCSAGQGDGNKDKDKGCIKCKSTFLTNLSEGKILDGQTLTGGWNRKDKTLTEIRNSDKVKWAVNK